MGTTTPTTTMPRRGNSQKRREASEIRTTATIPATTRTTPQKRSRVREITQRKARIAIPATTTTPVTTPVTTTPRIIAATTVTTVVTITTTTTRATTTTVLVEDSTFATDAIQGLVLLEYPSSSFLVSWVLLGPVSCFGAGSRKNSGAGIMTCTANLVSRQYTAVAAPLAPSKITEMNLQTAVSARLAAISNFGSRVRAPISRVVFNPARRGQNACFVLITTS